MRKTYHMFTGLGNIKMSKLVNGAKENLPAMLKHGGVEGLRFALMEGINQVSKRHPEASASLVRESIAFEFIDVIPKGIHYSIWLLDSIRTADEILRAKREQKLEIDFPGILG